MIHRLPQYSCLFVLLFCMGCGAAEKTAKRSGVSGTVSLDGELVSRARIVFVHDSEVSDSRIESEVVDGAFRIDSSNGPLVGNNTVQLLPPEIEFEDLESLVEGEFESSFVLGEMRRISDLLQSGSARLVTVDKDDELNQFEIESI